MNGCGASTQKRWLYGHAEGWRRHHSGAASTPPPARAAVVVNLVMSFLRFDCRNCGGAVAIAAEQAAIASCRVATSWDSAGSAARYAFAMRSVVATSGGPASAIPRRRGTRRAASVSAFS
jgi:hypothetical protein